MLKNYHELKEKLEELSNKITEGLILRSKVQWFEHGEKSSKYFLNLEKKRKSKTYVRKLLDDEDREIIEEKLILKRLGNYFEKIYDKKNFATEEECHEFINQSKTNKLTEEEKMKLEGKLTIQECYKSLTMMGKDKTPGNDGLSKNFT